MSATIQVAVVDDHPLSRRGLAFVLGREVGVEVIGEAGNAAEALALAHAVTIDVAVVDMMLPVTSGVGLCSALVLLQPQCRVLGLSVIEEPGLIADMLRAGACGYALKTQNTDEIVAAIRQVAAGARYLPPTTSIADVETALRGSAPHVLDRLTPREHEVFELLIRGHSNDEISTRLVISRRTVETHRVHITRKLSVHSIAEMQRLAAVYSWRM